MNIIQLSVVDIMKTKTIKTLCYSLRPTVFIAASLVPHVLSDDRCDKGKPILHSSEST